MRFWLTSEDLVLKEIRVLSLNFDDVMRVTNVELGRKTLADSHHSSSASSVLCPRGVQLAKLAAQDALFEALRTKAQTQASIERSIVRLKASHCQLKP